MSETIEAVFDRGVFTPCAPVSIPNGQRVTITYAPRLLQNSRRLGLIYRQSW